MSRIKRLYIRLRAFWHKLGTTLTDVLLCTILCLMILGIMLYLFYDDRYPVIFWVAIGVLIWAIFEDE
jgi:hypothetical protein